jgi:hypothetical protein
MAVYWFLYRIVIFYNEFEKSQQEASFRSGGITAGGDCENLHLPLRPTLAGFRVRFRKGASAPE